MLGRNDDQIKVRGQMVNLVEVDTKATALDFVHAAGCRSYPNSDGGTEIALYCCMNKGEEVRIGEVRVELMKVMENFAVPTVIEAVVVLPYNANGKLVRRDLKTPQLEPTAPAGGEVVACE